MQSVRIETVETFVVAMPLVAVFSSGGKSKNVTKGVVVKITASDGSYGISSVDPSTRAVFPDRAEDIAATVREKITPAVLGMSPTNINRLSDIMGSLQDIQIGARAAVEMAAIDLTCRRLGFRFVIFLVVLCQTMLPLMAGLGSCQPKTPRLMRRGGPRLDFNR